jgi:hypothetical protein
VPANFAPSITYSERCSDNPAVCYPRRHPSRLRRRTLGGLVAMVASLYLVVIAITSAVERVLARSDRR